MMIDLTGQQFGKYRLMRHLGAGGFASVYLGQHEILDARQAAIKILHMTEVDTKQFQHEAETLEALAHPHIVRLLEFDIQRGIPFLVMDYAPGGSLRTRHPKRTLVPLAMVVQYVKEIVPALQYAHNHNIIHRDIKPENLLIGRHGELLLSDFGIAVLSKTGRTSLEASYNIGGTSEYMAPEMFSGKPEKASDQYALAIVVYEWLCGTPPFTEGNAIQLGFQHSYTPTPTLRDKLPTVAPHVETVIMKALAKNPKERFPSVQAFADALEAASKVPGTRLLTYRGHGDEYSTFAWSPDGRFFATGGVSGLIQVWQASTGTLLSTWEGSTSKVHALVWSPDGSRLASASEKTVQVWEASSGRLLHTYTGHSDWVWEASSGRLLHTYTGHSDWVWTLAWSPDSSRLASGSNTVQVWEAGSGRLLHTYTGHSDVVNALAWSPDGSRLASGSDDRTVQVWEAGSGRLLHTYTGHSSRVLALAWSPDGSRLASGSDDRTVQVWEAGSISTRRTAPFSNI